MPRSGQVHDPPCATSGRQGHIRKAGDRLRAAFPTSGVRLKTAFRVQAIVVSGTPVPGGSLESPPQSCVAYSRSLRRFVNAVPERLVATVAAAHPRSTERLVHAETVLI